MTQDGVRPGYWFKPKRFGYGATPVTWQGWAVLIAYVAAVFFIVHDLAQSHPAFFWLLAPLTLILIWVSWTKTDGAWRWRS